MSIELRTLSDGGQTPTEIARELATFLGGARMSLDIAVYDVRFETDAGALVLATLLAAQQRGIDVRDFIQRNVTPYDGDESFLVEPSERTKAVWDKLQPYFKEEIRKGVLDVDAKTPSSLTAHQPGYIDRDNELIVGLQTDAPFRRAIMPLWRVAHGRVRAEGGRL